MIVLKTLRWSNLFSYGKNNELDFTKDKVVQLVGTNGNGKSSIAWIIEEALYNKNSKNRKKESLINWNTNEKSYSIELDFQVDNDTYTVKVKRSSTVSIALIKNGTDISSHTATNTFKQIEEILGYPFKTFCQILFQTHSSSLEFLNSPDTARKKFLIELINLSKYTDIGTVFKKIQSEITKELSYVQGRVTTVEDWIGKNIKIDRKKIELLENIDIDPSLLVKKDELKVKVATADSINKKISNNTAYKQSIANIDISQIPSKPEEDIRLFISEKAILTKTISDAKNTIEKVKKLKDSCPTCLQSITDDLKESFLTCEEEKISEANASLISVNAHIKVIQESLDTWESYIKNQAELEKLHCLIDNTLPEEYIDKTNIEIELKNINQHIQTTLETIEYIKTHNKNAEIHNNKIDLIDDQLQSYEEELKTWKAKYTEISNRISNISTLVKAFSTTGLVAYKLETITNSLQEIVNEYLVALSKGQFQLIFSLSDGDKLDIIISNNGVNTDISSLSAGETTRVNIAVLLGIRKLMHQISGNSINLLFLDESISTLDAEGKDRLVEVLLNEEDINTIIVSHEYQHPLIPNIQVLKENNISYLIRE